MLTILTEIDHRCVSKAYTGSTLR